MNHANSCLEKWAAAGGEELDIEAAMKSAADGKAVYADPERRFPVHTKAATMASVMGFYALEPKEQDPATEQALNKYAKFWNIEADFSKFASDMQVTTEIKYALEDTQEIPLVDVEKAAEALVIARAKLPYPVAKTAAQRILDAGHIDNYGLRREIEKIAGVGCCTKGDVEVAAYGRYNSNRNHEEKQALDFMIANSDKIASCPELLMKAATMLDNFDEFDEARDGRAHAEDYLFHMDPKVKKANEEEPTVKLANGRSIFLKKCSKEVLEILGEDFVEHVSNNGELDPIKVATVLRSLPLPDANLLCTRL